MGPTRPPQQGPRLLKPLAPQAGPPSTADAPSQERGTPALGTASRTRGPPPRGPRGGTGRECPEWAQPSLPSRSSLLLTLPPDGGKCPPSGPASITKKLLSLVQSQRANTYLTNIKHSACGKTKQGSNSLRVVSTLGEGPELGTCSKQGSLPGCGLQLGAWTRRRTDWGTDVSRNSQ